MIQIKLNLNSKHSTKFYAFNGKAYILKPGSNTLNLEYEDYISLAKALGINPIENKPIEDTVEQDKSEIEDIRDNIEKTCTEPISEPLSEIDASSVDNNYTESENASSEPLVEEQAKLIDYSSWSTTKLKAEYKKITGNTCKLKKEEIINFLQEQK